MGKIGFFFAGQGAQYAGMGQSLYESSKAAKEVFDAAETIRPGTIAQCFFGTAEQLLVTINTQPCLFAVDYACAAALKEAGVHADMAAGFSLGEVPAAAFCGILTFEDAFRLVIKRAEYMHECARKYPGSMVAVLRVDAQIVDRVAQQFENVYPVNYNCPNQTVVSGSDLVLPSFGAAMQEAGGRLMPLKVSGSFHSPYMEEAAMKLTAYMEDVAFYPPRIPLYANATALPYHGDPSALLARQVKSPVYFQKSVENMLHDGLTTCIEVGAGKTLCGLINKTGGAARVLNVQDAPSLEAALAALREDGVC
ncbi:ACP S-malonyltransferase [Christensenellaceae bacterium OttesenSCG-928-M15]|nr:ACP S-malonyltransferase [Christensenellaceae bacterium OttesenSCG-928-M15]